MPKYLMGIIAAVITGTILASVPWAISVQSNIASINTSLENISTTAHVTASLVQETRDEQLRRSNDVVVLAKVEASLVIVTSDLMGIRIDIEKLKTERFDFERRLRDMEKK